MRPSVPAPEEVFIDASRQPMVVTFDAKELVVLLFEAMVEIRRPPGATVDEALAVIRHAEPRLHADLQRMAAATMDYVAGRMQAAAPERLQ